LTGGTQGYWLSYINAGEAFGAAITFQMVVMALVGGLGTPFGPLIGAGFLTLVSELLGTQFVHHYLIAIGVIIVAICLFLPGGLVSATALLRTRRRASS
jgi:branched-chain amino acid transport system permease protein